MTGRVLSDEQIQKLENVYGEYHSTIQYGVDVLDLIATIRSLKEEIDATHQQCIDLIEEREEAREQSAKWYGVYLHQKEQNAIMCDFLATLRERAQNDINIRTKQGQHVGSLTFASLQEARQVRAVVNALSKVGDEQ